MRRFLVFVVLALVFISLGSAAYAGQDQAADLTAQGARTYSSRAGLTNATANPPGQVVADFLRSRGRDESILSSLVVETEVPASGEGLTHVRFGQVVNGLDVYGTYARAALTSHGEIVHLVENLASATVVVPNPTSPTQALAAALALHYPGSSVGSVLETRGNTTVFSQDGSFFTAPTATRVAIPMANGTLHEGYLVETWSGEGNLLHHTLVGRGGQVLGSQLRTNDDSYNIFPDHPGNSTQTIVAGPGAGNVESPSGWLAGSQLSVNISGNNVHAYLDRDANNAPDAGGVAVTDGNFVTVANLAQEPEVPSNQEVAVQNLFYLNNRVHDKLYRHGFTEAFGNFQVDNFGKGGVGGDPVNAEAQDGSGTNNANFSTPSDGSSGRMQMFLWTQTTPKRDGDVDSDIVWHEYGHGLTWRMIGNMSGPMSGAIGEGMSDVLSILVNNDDVVGEYSFNNPNGIRSAPYTNYPRTYGNFGGSSVHFDGEIYAATLWRTWELFQANAIAQDTLFDYIVQGMKFTPAGPAMEDMRDGILQAAAGTGHECIIWEAFAQFGIGVGAQAKVKGGGPFGGGSVSITESFDVPAECGGTQPPPTCAAVGDACRDDIDCCSGLCSGGRPASRVCLAP